MEDTLHSQTFILPTMFLSIVKADGTVETKSNLSRMELVAHMEQECAINEARDGIPPRITEYCNAPDIELNEWDRLPTPTPEEEDDYGSFCPPIMGYKRIPPTLLSRGVENLVGRTIVKYHTCVGTYGMGGSGWVGLELEGSDDSSDETLRSPPLFLVYCVWGADNWIHLPYTITPETPISLKIQHVTLEDQLFQLDCVDTTTQLPVTIRTDTTPVGQSTASWEWLAQRGHGFNATVLKMGELWHCCHPKGEQWC